MPYVGRTPRGPETLTIYLVLLHINCVTSITKVIYGILITVSDGRLWKHLRMFKGTSTYEKRRVNGIYVHIQRHPQQKRWLLMSR